MRLSRWPLLATTAAFVAGLTGMPGASVAQVPASYFVGCEAAADSNSGRSPDAAWRTLERASSAALRPGDSLLVQRGCVWDGERLDLGWDGTASAPIVVATYGDPQAPRPVIQNGGWTNVRIDGSYLEVSSLSVRHDPPGTIQACGQPIGDYYGFVLADGAHHNVLRRSRATREMAGLLLSQGSSYNTVTHNEFVGNNVMQTFGTDKDLGAWGMTLNGNHQEVSDNVFKDNKAECPNPAGIIYSKSVNLYAAQHNTIHHNFSSDRVFSELGSSDTGVSEDNLYAYNVFTPTLPSARFIVTRGAGDTAYGPVLSTRVLNNSVYAVAEDGQGTVCVKGCGSDVLTVRSNVLYTSATVMFADRTFAEGNNILWTTSGRPNLPFEPSASDVLADPWLVDPAGGDLSLTAASPAVDASTSSPPYAYDFDHKGVPQGNAPDIGGYELQQADGDPVRVRAPS